MSRILSYNTALIALLACCTGLVSPVAAAEPEKKSKADWRLTAVDLPAGEGTPIDRLLARYFAEKKVVPRPIDDAVFIRRVTLDLVGRLPTPAELEAFLADGSIEKRTVLIDRLLADSQGYADHWITLWQDLLRDGKHDLGSTDIFRPITPWLERSLRENVPYDRFVRELVSPPDLEKVIQGDKVSSDDGEKNDKAASSDRDSSGFVFGTRAGLERPRGDQAWEVQAAQNICQVFLGIQLKCATCHDSFLDSWTMDDAWGVAAIYAAKPLEMVRCELPTGKHASARFLIPELGDVDLTAKLPERRAQFAELLTARENGLFARTAVNRMWTALFGRGLIDSADDMSEPCRHPEVLDWLAADFIEHEFDLKHLIRTIVLSRAYQAEATQPEPDRKDYVFRGPLVRRMSAEQFLDGIHALVGREKRVWRDQGSGLMETLGRPDRRTICTARENKASSMQTLELLNGGAIHELIYGLEDRRGKVPGESGVKFKSDQTLNPTPQAALEKLAKEPRDAIATSLFRHAFSRTPNERESAISRELLGEKPQPEQIGDLLWGIVMLPEFQLIR